MIKFTFYSNETPDHPVCELSFPLIDINFYSDRSQTLGWGVLLPLPDLRPDLPPSALPEPQHQVGADLSGAQLLLPHLPDLLGTGSIIQYIYSIYTVYTVYSIYCIYTLYTVYVDLDLCLYI